METNLKLITPYEVFKQNIEALLLESDNLYKRNVSSDKDLIDLKEKTNLWENKVIEVLDSSFNVKGNEIQTEFKNTGSISYRIPGIQPTLNQEIEHQKKLIQEKNFALWGNLRVLSVLDAVIKPDTINLDQRRKYTTDEKLFLILEKLYELYDDYYYPISDILIGNGINLRRQGEEYEFIDLLETRGLVEKNQFGISVEMNARLTPDGSIFIEENLKVVKENYDDIKLSSEQLNKRIDNVVNQLTDLGLGHQILFDELQELKELFLKLNKKNWGQILKGKLIDLAMGKVIENDTIKMIYEAITNHQLHLPK